MALGFKIADGYVDVHAKYDKGDLEKTAQQAADDHDKAFSKEHERNSRDSGTRASNRKVGRQARKDFTEGFFLMQDRLKKKPLIHAPAAEVRRQGRVSALHFSDGFDKEVGRQAPRWHNIGRRISNRIGRGLTGRESVGNIVAAFF